MHHIKCGHKNNDYGIRSTFRINQWGAFMAERKTHEMFLEEMAQKQPSIEVLGAYSGARTNVAVRCKICGHTWDSMPTNLLKGRSCPACAYKKRGEKRSRQADDVVSALKISNPEIEIIGDYQNTGTKVLAKCKRCGYDWNVLPQSLLRGSGCPKCSHTGTSYVEQIIFLSLQMLTDEEIVSRVRSIIDRELDIYLPSKHFAVEYGAWLWHKGKEDADKKKIEQCADKGIKLIEIFDAYDGEEKYTENIWYYKDNIGHKSNIHIVKEIIVRLCEELNVPFTLTEKDFRSIQYQARINSRRMTTATLNEKLKQRNIIVLNEYQDMLTKVAARCLVCGHEWNVVPASLLRGLGCPACGVRRRSNAIRKTNESFLKEMAECNPNIEIIGEYTGRHSPIMARCKKHNYIWSSRPDSLLKGAGCPICLSEKLSKAQVKTHKQFVQEISEINPNIEVIGQYIRGSAKIDLRCKVCSHEWKAVPSALLSGEGCPKCGRLSQAEKRRKTNEQFLLDLEISNPDLLPLETYHNAHTKIRVQCRKCSNIWDSEPSSLLHGNGCPYCAGNHKKTQSMFLEEMRNIHPTIEVLGTYTNAKAKVAVKCTKCGYEWSDTPSNLISLKRGCRQCAKK